MPNYNLKCYVMSDMIIVEQSSIFFVFSMNLDSYVMKFYLFVYSYYCTND